MHDTSFCGSDPLSVGDASMCPGYTGSPVMCSSPDGESSFVYGLQSYNWACSGAPSVYTKISALREFIDYILSKYEP